MNDTPAGFRRWALLIGQFSLIAVLALGITPTRAEDAPAATPGSATATNNPDAEGDKAWKELRKATQEPMPPAEWQAEKPTREQIAKFYVEALHKGADKAKDFYTRFPNHLKAADAHKLEYRLLSMATQRFGDTSQGDRLMAIEAVRMKDPNLTPEERFKLRMAAAQRLGADLPDNLDEFVKSAQALQKDFPDREEPYQLLLGAAMQTEGDTSKKLCEQIIDGNAPDKIKQQAKGMLRKMDSLGKPVDIQYTALDGREVNVGKLKGKVVLVDFWATWCGPCVGEIPNVKSAFSHLHDQGFEIVGISFDKEKDTLQRFVTENKMEWPQFFDGEVWNNKFGKEFGINSIPTMWLVDKKGNLRDLNGRDGLEEKVKKLLAE
jgi:thiol-disulfide isomerase/thioredoxin